MKKILYATTAIAAVSAISAANAQESSMMSAAGNDLSIGGYYEFGYASGSDDRGGEENGADTFTYGESELYIDFETTSDTGLTYGVQLDLEVVNGSRHAVDGGDPNNTDEASIYVSGNFGTINLGHDDYASSLYNIWAPTHEGSISQDDSVHGIRYGDGAALRFIGLNDNATLVAERSAAFARGEQVNIGMTEAQAAMALGNSIMSDNATADQEYAESLAEAVFTTVDPDDNTSSPALRGLQQSIGLAHTASLTQSNDNAKISYHSPNLGGLSFGGSFADDNATENSATSFGASFTGSVDEIPFVGGGFSYKLAGWQPFVGGGFSYKLSATALTSSKRLVQPILV